jgi:hypothetical protein
MLVLYPREEVSVEAASIVVELSLDQASPLKLVVGTSLC